MHDPEDFEDPPAPVCRGCDVTLDPGPAGTYADCPECGAVEIRAWPPVDDGPDGPDDEVRKLAHEAALLHGALGDAVADAAGALAAARVLARRVRGGASQAEVDEALAEVDWRSDCEPRRLRRRLGPDEREAVRRCCAAAAEMVGHFEAVTRVAFGHRSGAPAAMAYLRGLINDAACGDAANARVLAEHLAQWLA